MNALTVIGLIGLFLTGLMAGVTIGVIATAKNKNQMRAELLEELERYFK